MLLASNNKDPNRTCLKSRFQGKSAAIPESVSSNGGEADSVSGCGFQPQYLRVNFGVPLRLEAAATILKTPLIRNEAIRPGGLATDPYALSENGPMARR